MGLKLIGQTIKTGDITFAVSNKTSMKRPHEVPVIPNPAVITALKLVADGSKLDADSLHGLMEGGKLTPGETKATVLSLKPGKCLVFCNQSGHFAAGMHQELTVTD